MKFDTWLLSHNLQDMPAITQAVEEIGFDGLWTAEGGKNGFFPLVLAAEHSKRINMGTCIAVAFPRSPTILAHLAWDLAQYSEGRFILGLGTQVRAHIERRFSVKWEKPVRKMRETIEAMHAIWDSWQNGTRLKYEGEFFQLSLMTPFFSGPRLDIPRPPVYISAINKMMLNLSGKVCDGVHLHPFHSVKYLKEFAWPNIEEGLKVNGRTREEFTAVCPVFAVPTDGTNPASKYEAHVRDQLSFYMSTPAYRVVLELHGWQDVGVQLSKLARQGEWKTMSTLITDEMLDTFAVTGKWGELPTIIHERYGDLVDRTNYYLTFVPGEEDEGWKASVAGFEALRAG